MILKSLAVFFVLASVAQAEELYHVAATIPLGAPDRWDYVVDDSANHRVYVAHGDEVTVIDSRTRQVAGQITGFPGGTHGIAVVPAAGVGVTDDGKQGVAGLFDLKSLQPVAKLDAAPDADSVTLDPRSGDVFVIDGDSMKITVIDPAKRQVVGTIDTGEGMETPAADGEGNLFVNGSQKGELIRIDTATDQISARWPLPDCSKPHGLAMDKARRRLFVSCVNDVLKVVNADNGTVVASLPIGAGTDTAAYDPVRKRIFSSNGKNGSVTVIGEEDANHFSVLGTVTTQISGRTMAVDPATGELFVAAATLQPAEQNQRPKPQPGSLKLLVLEPG